jgi:hypothetical protein
MTVVAKQGYTRRVAVVTILLGLLIAVALGLWVFESKSHLPRPTPQAPASPARTTPATQGSTEVRTSPASSPPAKAPEDIGRARSVPHHSGSGETETPPAEARTLPATPSQPPAPIVGGGGGTDVYLVLDTSSSMLIPSTHAGIQTMRTADTSGPARGCAFACHYSHPRLDFIVIRDAKGQDILVDKAGLAHFVAPGSAQDCDDGAIPSPGTSCLDPASGTRFADPMWFAENHGSLYGGRNIELRIDAETIAARDLIAVLRTRELVKATSYRLQAFSFGLGAPKPLTGSIRDVNRIAGSTLPDLASLQTAWYQNNRLTKTSSEPDSATNFTAMFNGLNSTIPLENAALPTIARSRLIVIVTDGMTDEAVDRMRRLGGLTPAHLAQCEAIKRRGIRIAIVYTEYSEDMLAGDYWSKSAAVPHLPEIEPALRQCASLGPDGAPLLAKVGLDQNLSNALLALSARALADG